MHHFHKLQGTYNHQKDDCFLSYERDLMLSRLKLAYGEGNWNNDLKLPDHLHCTHTFVPIK